MPTAAPAISPKTAPEAPPLIAPLSSSSTPSEPANRLAKYISASFVPPSARSSRLPNWNSRNMFIAMWNTPKWMKPDVTRRYHW